MGAVWEAAPTLSRIEVSLAADADAIPRDKSIVLKVKKIAIQPTLLCSKRRSGKSKPALTLRTSDGKFVTAAWSVFSD
jgi:hypothetical protein